MFKVSYVKILKGSFLKCQRTITLVLAIEQMAIIFSLVSTNSWKSLLTIYSLQIFPQNQVFPWIFCLSYSLASLCPDQSCMLLNFILFNRNYSYGYGSIMGRKLTIHKSFSVAWLCLLPVSLLALLLLIMLNRMLQMIYESTILWSVRSPIILGRRTCYYVIPHAGLGSW